MGRRRRAPAPLAPLLLLLAAARGAAAVAPHGLLDRGASLTLLRRMRPPVEDHIVLLQDLYRHSLARRAFVAHPDARTLVDADLNLFVVSVEGERLDLHAVVWNAPRARRAFHALRAWHRAHFPHGTLAAPRGLHHPEDRTKWEESDDGLLDDL